MTLETRNTNTEKVKRVKIQLQTGLINAQSSIYEFSSDNKFTQSWKNTEAFSANCTINHQSRCQNHWKPWKFRTNVSWMVVRYLQNFNCQLICQFILIWWHCTWETKEKKINATFERIFFFRWKKIWREKKECGWKQAIITFNQLDRHVELLTVALLFFGLSVIQRHHLQLWRECLLILDKWSIGEKRLHLEK